jgi:hypothetical protein
MASPSCHCTLHSGENCRTLRSSPPNLGRRTGSLGPQPTARWRRGRPPDSDGTPRRWAIAPEASLVQPVQQIKASFVRMHVLSRIGLTLRTNVASFRKLSRRTTSQALQLVGRGVAHRSSATLLGPARPKLPFFPKSWESQAGDAFPTWRRPFACAGCSTGSLRPEAPA